MIPPDAQRLMSKRAGSTVVEAEGSQAIYVSKSAAVAELIQTAVAELRELTPAAWPWIGSPAIALDPPWRWRPCGAWRPTGAA
jgi:hypothetical protein